jgi:hypothetical protein
MLIKGRRCWGRYPFLIGILFIPRLNVYAAGFLSGMIGSKGDLKQGILGALTAGFMHPMKAGITFCALCAHVLAWLLTPAASYAPDQLAP